MPKRRKLDEGEAAADSMADTLVREKPKPCKYLLGTGSTLLNLAVSDRARGGVGSGRVVQIIGDNSTAKTVVAKEILGAAQRLGGSAIEEDSEYTPDFDRADLFGLAVGPWVDEQIAADLSDLPVPQAFSEARKMDDHCWYAYRNPQSIEHLFDSEIGPAVLLTEGLGFESKTKTNNKTNKTTTEIKTVQLDFSIPQPLAISVDTFTALPSEAEENRGLTDNSYNMERAKSMSGGFRKWLKHVGRTNTTIVAVDHIRKKAGVIFGPDWTTSGGLAMQQYASTRIFLAYSGSILNKAETEVGVWIRAKVIKNKIAPPHREARFAVLFDYGIDDVRSNLEWLKEQKVDSKLKINGAWYNWGEERLGQGLEQAILAVEERRLEDAIIDEVERVWHVVHAAPDRREKQR